MSTPRVDPKTDPYLNKSETPVYLDHCVIWRGEEYRIYLDGNEHRDFLELPAKLELAEPRPPLEHADHLRFAGPDPDQW